MSRVVYQTVTVTNTGATQYSGYVNGRILGIRYVPGTIDTGATVTVTTETTAQSVLVKASAGTSNVWFYPKILGSKNADGTSSATYHDIYAINERIKVVISSGGATFSGSVGFLTDDNAYVG